MRHLICGMAMAVVATSAQASGEISGAGSLPGANPIYLPEVNLTGAGPVDLGGVVWTSTKATSLFGWTGGYISGNKTILPGEGPIIALNEAWGNPGYATMTLTFATPTAGFLAEFFWTDNEYTGLASAVIAAYDSSASLLGYVALNNNGSGIGMQEGYYGFLRGTADISYINISNSHIGAMNLTYLGPTIGRAPGSSAVPEPASWALMIAGFGLAGATLRRRTLHLSRG